jgi:hypothetical protein
MHTDASHRRRRPFNNKRECPIMRERALHETKTRYQVYRDNCTDRGSKPLSLAEFARGIDR